MNEAEPASTGQELIADYMNRLTVATATLSADERRDLELTVDEHFSAGLEDLEYPPTATDVLNIIERLGPPEQFAPESDRRAELHWQDAALAAIATIGIAIAWLAPIFSIGAGLVSIVGGCHAARYRRVIVTLASVAIIAGITVWAITRHSPWGGASST